MLKHLFTIPTILCLAAIGTPIAKADMMFAGLDMDVLLHPISATEVQVTVTLSGGATAFVNTGNGTNHPGFAFNLGGAPITVANIVDVTNLGAFHIGPIRTNGPDLGTFGYYFDNVGNGASAKNAGPLTFDIRRASGIAPTDFIANADGYYFTADVLNPAKNKSVDFTSAAFVTITAIPEPTSILLLATTCMMLIAYRRRIARLGC